MDDAGIAVASFDLENSSVNKFNRDTLADLIQVVDRLSEQPCNGLILTSAKSGFIVGADITEFTSLFKRPDDEFAAVVGVAHELFARIEDLPFPTVAAINGLAFGGGFELCLACDFRVLAESAVVGLPEIKLGLFPGWGGTMRLPRLAGIDAAIGWIVSGRPQKPAQALASGAADRVVSDGELLAEARRLIAEANAGELDTGEIHRRKTSPLILDEAGLESMANAKASASARFGTSYPAATIALETMEAHLPKSRAEASAIEIAAFVRVAKTDAANSMVGLFLNDQFLKRQIKAYTATAREISQVGVLGAGIMGGGIAYQTALNKIPVVMKDIRTEALDLGLKEAGKRLSSQLERGRLKQAEADAVMQRISATLEMQDLRDCDFVVEAVVENPDIKLQVLGELEASLAANSVIATNTSTISIDRLAADLNRPENFCGVHFFNPVHVMPLVEVIRGSQSSDETIATAVEYVRRIGKNPIVVNNCPGFLVNRVLFPYLAAFDRLVFDGVDYREIDAAMTAFGWPMGPAYLLDVVGIDTAVHGAEIMADGFPDRMAIDFTTPTRKMFEAGRLGQKSGSGYYRYQPGASGKPEKIDDEAAFELVYGESGPGLELGREEIVARMMAPLCIELARCIEDGIVDSAEAADMGLIWGLGFPAHVGGGLRYLDRLGMNRFCELADTLAHLGPAYHVTAKMRQRGADGQLYFPIGDA